MPSEVEGSPEAGIRVFWLEIRPENILHLLAVQTMGGRGGQELDQYARLWPAPGVVWHYLAAAFARITDGTSNTILVVETADTVPWTKPDDFHYDPKKPLPKLGEPSRDGFYALMADGSVRYIPKNTDEKIVRAMITRAGNETFQLPGQQQ